MSVPANCHADRRDRARSSSTWTARCCPGRRPAWRSPRPSAPVDQLHDLEARFAAGDLDTRGFAAEVHDLFAALTAEQITATFRAARLLDRAADVFADIRARGERSLVITMSPDFFAASCSRSAPTPCTARASRRRRTPAWRSTRAGSSRRTTSRASWPRRSRRPASTPTAASRSATRCPTPRCSARSAHTVAVNADDHLLDLAATTYVGDDLWAAYELGRSLLD